MEKLEKKVEYLSTLALAFDGGKTLTTEELYSAIKTADELCGITLTEWGVISHRKKVISDLKNLYGDRFVEKPSTKKSKGRAKNLEFYIIPEEKKEEEPVVVASPKKKRKYNCPAKKTSDRVWRVLCAANETTSKTLTFKRVSELICKQFTAQVAAGWRISLRQHDCPFDFVIEPGKGAENVIRILNIQSTMITFAEMYKVWYGVELDVKSILHLHDTKPVQLKNPVKIIREKEIVAPVVKESNKTPDPNVCEEDKKLIYYLAGYLYMSIGSPSTGGGVSFATINSFFRSNLSINIGRQDLERLSRIEPEIIVNKQYNYVRLDKAGNSYNKILKKYNISECVGRVLARIQRPIEDVEKYVGAGNVEIVESFLPEDNIVSITQERTVNGTYNLLRLYLTFHGKERYIDKELTNEMILKEKQLFAKAMGENVLSQIESEAKRVLAIKD